MTTHEAFKKRVRTRMAKTGEKYAAARRQLLTPPSPPPSTWAAQPEHTDDAIAVRTGRRWDDWVRVIDAGPGHEATHTAIANWLTASEGIDPWWAQAVTVGFERITGRRLPGQMADGTFTISRSRTLSLNVEDIRALLLDEAGRSDLLPSLATTLRSRPTAKRLRLGLDDPDTGTSGLLFSFDPAPGGRTRLAVTHDGLPTLAAGDAWKARWGAWLDDLEATTA